MIMAAELRQMVHGLPLPTPGHRGKFGNDPKKHVDFSAVTHVAKGKGIPPLLILHVAGPPDTTAQAKRLGAVLQQAEIPVKVFGAQETTHSKLNTDSGMEELADLLQSPSTSVVLADHMPERNRYEALLEPIGDLGLRPFRFLGSTGFASSHRPRADTSVAEADGIRANRICVAMAS